MSPPASSHLVGFRLLFHNRFPEILADISRGRPDADDEFIDGLQVEARLEQLYLVRTVALPGIPREGEMVEANPNWEPVAVVEVEWFMDAEVGQPQVEVHLEALDEDHVGRGSLELLLDAGWVPALDRL